MILRYIFPFLATNWLEDITNAGRNFLRNGILMFNNLSLIRVDKRTNFIERRERFSIGIVFIAIGIYVMIEGGSIGSHINLFK